jgi:hypothetical protein
MAVEVNRRVPLAGPGANDPRVLEPGAGIELDHLRRELEAIECVTQHIGAHGEPAARWILGVYRDESPEQFGHLLCARFDPERNAVAEIGHGSGSSRLRMVARNIASRVEPTRSPK